MREVRVGDNFEDRLWLRHSAEDIELRSVLLYIGLLNCTLAFLFLAGCSAESSYPPEVAEAIESAGDNAAQLEKVIEHYSQGDSLKLQAAYYLIRNMGDHCYVRYAMIDTSESEIDFNVMDYPDYDSLRGAVRSLESERGELDFTRAEKVVDLNSISADFLINQIDYAFRAWWEKPWARELPIEDFLEYVLPYRGSNEPLEPWRERFWEKYAGIDTLLDDSTDAVAVAGLINDDVKKWFTFDPRFYYHPTDQGLEEMLRTGLGRCEDMTNVAIYAMRANGLAVTSDYTPHWADANGNHAWNALVTPAGEVIPFMGAEANPRSYGLPNKLAKVYRKMFGEQRANLVFQERKQEAIPSWLGGKSYIDVTADYVDVCDIMVKLNQPIPDSVDIAYLCVFNSGEFHAIQWGRIENGRATFKGMGPDILYLPALYLNGEIVPSGDPFLLGSDCSMAGLVADSNRRRTMHLTSTTRRRQSVATDSVEKSSLHAGTRYELFYWQDGWQSAGAGEAGKQPLTIGDVPTGALYRLVADGSDNEERIFTYEQDQQRWW